MPERPKEAEMGARYAFVDESGNPSLNTDKSGTHYVVVGVVPVGEPAQASGFAERVRAKHFGPGEIKSSGVGGDDERRLRILADLGSAPVNCFAICVDKRRIDPTTGLLYKRSFRKFMQQRLHRKLLEGAQDIVVTVDEHGSPEFMQEFEEYVRRRSPTTLFGSTTFHFVDSRSEPLIQVADFVAGSLFRCVTSGLRSEANRQILGALRPLMLAVETWPPDPMLWGQAANSTSDRRHDAAVAEVAGRSALRFIEDHVKDAAVDEEVRRQLEVLQFLLFRFQADDRSDYVPTHEIREVLSSSFPVTSDDGAKRAVRTAVAGLRDGGVLIASSPRGYKVPANIPDVMDFVNQSVGVVGPMLSRLAKARRRVSEATSGDVDVLADPGLEPIRRAVLEMDGDVVAIAGSDRGGGLA